MVRYYQSGGDTLTCGNCGHKVSRLVEFKYDMNRRGRGTMMCEDCEKRNARVRDEELRVKALQDKLRREARPGFLERLFGG